jgi:NADH-quinone oxidoreductase subunit J
MAPALFHLFALLAIASAIGVVVNRNAVNAAMSFLLSLVGVAGLFVQLDAYLLAFLLLLVYAGAVVALFLFIIMLLDTQGAKTIRSFPKFPIFVSLVSLGLLLTGLSTFVARGQLDAPNPNAAGGVGAALKPYAYQLFTTYLLPVQVMGFLLLIAMLGVIVLSKKIDGLEDVK